MKHLPDPPATFLTATGDCCASSCLNNNSVFLSCGTDTFNCLDPRDADPLKAYVSPAAAYFDCAVTTNSTADVASVIARSYTSFFSPCQKAALTVTRLPDTRLPASGDCPQPFTYLRQWNLTKKATYDSSILEQRIYFYDISQTLDPVCVLVDSAHYPSLGFSFGSLMSSPDLAVTVPSSGVGCDTSSRLVFADCIDPTGTCTYDGYTDELFLSGLPQVGDTYTLKQGFVDACGNLYVVQRQINIVDATTTGACIHTRPAYLPTNQKYSNNVLGERLPTTDVGRSTGLVCTEVTVTNTSVANTWQVTVGVTADYPGCIDSAGRGRLQALYFNILPFNVSSPANLTFINGTIRLGSRIDTKTASSSISAGITSHDYIAQLFDVDFELADLPIWGSAQTTRLGVFWISGPSTYSPGNDGWFVGFEYDALPYYLTSSMVGLVSKPPVPDFVVKPDWVTVVSSPIIPYESAIQSLPGFVCTAVTASRIDIRKAEICLSVTNTAPGCSASAANGTLRGIFMDNFLFDTVPDLLTVENGTLSVVPSPDCWLPFNTDLSGSVQQCNGVTINGVNSFEFEWTIAVTTNAAWTQPNQALGVSQVIILL